jgi:hypothetical protein
VARRLENLQGDFIAEAQPVAVLHRREAVFSLRPRPQVNGRTHTVAKLQVASDEVGVLVRQKHVADLDPLLKRVFYVPLHVALWVHHRGHPRALIRNQVRSVRQAAQVILFEDHCVLWSAAGDWLVATYQYHYFVRFQGQPFTELEDPSGNGRSPSPRSPRPRG